MRPGERRGWALALSCVAGFMLILDLTVVNVALPAIQHDLNAQLDALEWVVNAYALALGALLLTAGALVDAVQRRLAFATGVALFTVTSVLCGLAADATQLNLARAGQGVAGALLSASALALIGQEFRGQARDRALGLFAAVSGAATAIGPLVGGALVVAYGWRSVFLVNAPAGVALLALSPLLPRTATAAAGGTVGQRLVRLDWAGAITFGGALFAANLLLVRGNEHGWTSRSSVALMLTGAVLLAAFLAAEAWRRAPMLDLKLFGRPRFTAAILTSFTVRAGTFGTAFFLTLYLQGVLRLTPIQAGVRFLPLTVMVVLGALLAAGPLRRLGSAPVFALGYSTLVFGLIAVNLVRDGSGFVVLLPAFMLLGLGAGILTAPVLSVALGELPPERAGIASAVNTAFLPLGTAAGVAVLGAVFAGPQSAAAIAADPAGFIAGLHRGVLVAAGGVGVAGLISLALLRRGAAPATAWNLPEPVAPAASASEGKR